MQWQRKAAANGHAVACLQLANFMYGDLPYAREVGHVGEAVGVATSASLMEGHDVPLDVLTDVIRWLRKGGEDPVIMLDEIRRIALEGGKYCVNEGCEVVGHLKDFKVCPQCKTARYCAQRVRKRIGQRVGTRQRVAHSQVPVSCSSLYEATSGAFSEAKRCVITQWHNGVLLTV
jgi:hypothetical protein